MAAKETAAATVSQLLRAGLIMKPPTGHTTKTVNGVPQVVSAHEAWDHASTDQTDVATIKTFLNAVAVELYKRGDPDRARAALIQAASF